MTSTVLSDVRQGVGVSLGETGFDVELIGHINMALGFLQQLGIGPLLGYQIETELDTWIPMGLTPIVLGLAKSYLILKVRLAFDPPSNSAILTAMTAQISELESRLIIQTDFF